MRRLTVARPMSGHGSDEQGAILIMVVLLTITLVAMAALVVDVGALLDERRQLQNGADAGALAVAHSCGLGACDVALADGLANANSRDGQSVAAVTLPPGNRVKVTTSTRGSDGAILPYAFGQVLTGEKGKTVQATAIAGWGPPSSASALPLAISQCDLQQLGIGNYSVITFAKASGPCVARDTSGAFGWLTAPCPTTFSVGATVAGDPGSSGPSPCLVINSDVLLPVFDTVTGTGNNTRYHIVGFAALHVTGWRFQGSNASLPNPCGNSTCIAGTFLNQILNDPTGAGAGVGTGTGFGVSRIFLVS
jgi:Flp pilus assembly protein TadG